MVNGYVWFIKKDHVCLNDLDSIKSCFPQSSVTDMLSEGLTLGSCFQLRLWPSPPGGFQPLSDCHEATSETTHWTGLVPSSAMASHTLDLVLLSSPLCHEHQFKKQSYKRVGFHLQVLLASTIFPTFLNPTLYINLEDLPQLSQLFLWAKTNLHTEN